MEIDALPQKKTISKTRIILGGCFLVLMGLVFGYFFIYRKVEEMRQHQNLTYSMKAMIMVPFCIVFGIYCIIFKPAGGGAWKYLTKKEKSFFIAALLLCILVTAALAYWFSNKLTANGYDPLF